MKLKRKGSSPVESVEVQTIVLRVEAQVAEVTFAVKNSLGTPVYVGHTSVALGGIPAADNVIRQVMNAAKQGIEADVGARFGGESNGEE